jgi:hypothetical protein
VKNEKRMTNDQEPMTKNHLLVVVKFRINKKVI